MEQRTQIRKDLFKEGIKGFCKALNYQSVTNKNVTPEDCDYVFEQILCKALEQFQPELKELALDGFSDAAIEFNNMNQHRIFELITEKHFL